MSDTPGITRPQRPCTGNPGAPCHNLVAPPATRCATCAPTRNRSENQRSAHYQTHTWRTKTRPRILARDHHQCVVPTCQRGDTLQVHHIDHDAGATATTPDDRLVTLCRSCHAKLEREYQQRGGEGPLHRAVADHLAVSPAHQPIDVSTWGF